MADKTLASLTAATPAMGGLLYGTQGGADRKFTLSAAGASLMEAADSLKLDELAAPTDVTTLNATTSAHGLLPKLGGGTANFLRADGAWQDPSSPESPLSMMRLANVYTIGWSDCVVTTTGSGDRAYSSFLSAANTGSTSGSTSRLSAPNLYVRAPFYAAVTTPPLASARWTKPFVMLFSVGMSATTANGQAWIKFEQSDYTVGDLATRGVGIRVNDTTCVGIWHNGTTSGSTSTLLNFGTLYEYHQIAIISDGSGNITWVVDQVIAATVSTGPCTDETTAYTGFGGWVVEAANNADSASVSINCGAIAVRWD